MGAFSCLPGTSGRNVKGAVMKENKKMVEAITSMDEDFAQWYTDICLKAELVD